MQATDGSSDPFATVRAFRVAGWSLVRSLRSRDDSRVASRARVSAKAVLAAVVAGLLVAGLAYGTPNLLTLVLAVVLLAVGVLLLWALHRIWIGLGAPY